MGVVSTIGPGGDGACVWGHVPAVSQPDERREAGLMVVAISLTWPSVPIAPEDISLREAVLGAGGRE